MYQRQMLPCGLSAAGKAHAAHTWDITMPDPKGGADHGERFSCEGIKLAKVVLFKQSGKYYTEEHWRVPTDAVGPWDMKNSPDFRRIDNGAVLVESQEPWGYPILFPTEEAKAV